MVKKNCNSSTEIPIPASSSITVLQSYNALDRSEYEVKHPFPFTIKTIKSSDGMLDEIKEIASRAGMGRMAQILIHTPEQLTKNLLEKLITKCENSKKFKKNLHGVQIAFTRSFAEVNRNLVYQLNEIVEFELANFALSSLHNIFQTTSTKKEKDMWFVSEKNNLITNQIWNWAANNNLKLARLDGTSLITAAGVAKVYAYVTNSHEGEVVIEAMKDNNFRGSLSLIDCSKAFGASNRALVATMVADGLLEDAVELSPGTKYNLSEQEKQDLNTDKHENCLKATVDNLLSWNGS
jgi:hypothetical protein